MAAAPLFAMVLLILTVLADSKLIKRQIRVLDKERCKAVLLREVVFVLPAKAVLAALFLLQILLYAVSVLVRVHLKKTLELLLHLHPLQCDGWCSS